MPQTPYAPSCQYARHGEPRFHAMPMLVKKAATRHCRYRRTGHGHAARLSDEMSHRYMISRGV